jgi:hypothetical protein
MSKSPLYNTTDDPTWQTERPHDAPDERELQEGTFFDKHISKLPTVLRQLALDIEAGRVIPQQLHSKISRAPCYRYDVHPFTWTEEATIVFVHKKPTVVESTGEVLADRLALTSPTTSNKQ